MGMWTWDAQQQVAFNAGQPRLEDVFLGCEADTPAYFRHLANARELSNRATASADHAKERETAAVYEVEAALREALFGNTVEARQRIDSAVRLSIGRDAQ